MRVRITHREPDTQIVAEAVAEDDDYDVAVAAATARIPEGHLKLGISSIGRRAGVTCLRAS